MRSHLVGPLAAAMLIMGLAPTASAATSVIGDRFDDAGVRVVSQECVDSSELDAPTPPFVVRRDSTAPLGRGAIGWGPSTSGYETGPMVHIDSPSTLSGLSIQVNKHGSALSGHAIVRYPVAAFPGEWRGIAALPSADGDGWHAVGNATLAYRWRHYDASGELDMTASQATLQDFVAAHDGDGTGAWIGFAFGCNGDTFDVDALTVTSSVDNTTIDFEPYGSSASLRWAKGGGKRTTIIAGGKTKIRAALKDELADPLRGKLQLKSALVGPKKARGTARLKVDGSGIARATLTPVRTRVYWVRYAGTSSRFGDTSRRLTVRVRSNVRAHLSASTVVSGTSVAIVGKFWPGRPAKLRVQRYFGKEWHTVRVIRSAKDGSYRTTLTWKKVGKSYWRVLVPQGGGNLSGHSPAMKLTVKPKPKPPSHGGGGNNPPTNPTPPPDDDPQPPPPPTGPQ